MSLNFRTAALAVAAAGIALGIAFGVGVAYGRGDPKTVESGLTQQQIQSLLGIGGGQTGAGGTGASGGQSAGGAQSSGGTGGGAGQRSGSSGTSPASLGSNAVLGRVTEVSGQTVTVQTGQGSQRVSVAPSTSVSKLQTVQLPEVTEGLTIFATGARKDDGSFEAAAITQLPPELGSALTPASGATPAPGGR